MMNRLEEIKKSLLQVLEIVKGKVTETNTFNSIKEKYESLSLSRQKIFKNTILISLVFCMFIIPVYYFSSSVKSWRKFHTYWSLSFDLVRQKDYNPKLLIQTKESVKEQILDIVKKYESKNYAMADNSVPVQEKEIKATRYIIEVGPLNVRQAVQMGAELDEMPYSHLTSLTMEESKNYAKHYEVIFKVLVYSSTKKWNNLKPSRLGNKPARQDAKPSRFKKPADSNKSSRFKKSPKKTTRQNDNSSRLGNKPADSDKPSRFKKPPKKTTRQNDKPSRFGKKSVGSDKPSRFGDNKNQIKSKENTKNKFLDKDFSNKNIKRIKRKRINPSIQKLEL